MEKEAPRHLFEPKEKQQKLLKWFVLPNESYKWDFVLDKYVVEDFREDDS